MHAWNSMCLKVSPIANQTGQLIVTNIESQNDFLVRSCDPKDEGELHFILPWSTNIMNPPKKGRFGHFILMKSSESRLDDDFFG